MSSNNTKKKSELEQKFDYYVNIQKDLFEYVKKYNLHDLITEMVFQCFSQNSKDPFKTMVDYLIEMKKYNLNEFVDGEIASENKNKIIKINTLNLKLNELEKGLIHKEKHLNLNNAKATKSKSNEVIPQQHEILPILVQPTSNNEESLFKKDQQKQHQEHELNLSEDITVDELSSISIKHEKFDNNEITKAKGCPEMHQIEIIETSLSGTSICNLNDDVTEEMLDAFDSFFNDQDNSTIINNAKNDWITITNVVSESTVESIQSKSLLMVDTGSNAEEKNASKDETDSQTSVLMLKLSEEDNVENILNEGELQNDVEMQVLDDEHKSAAKKTVSSDKITNFISEDFELDYEP